MYNINNKSQIKFTLYIYPIHYIVIELLYQIF